jgi:hypothetical protein
MPLAVAANALVLRRHARRGDGRRQDQEPA